MRGKPAPKPSARPKQERGAVVRFALNGKRPRWKELLPLRWRRRVVIQGQRFVL